MCHNIGPVLTHLTASHPGGLKVDIVPDGKKMYFFKPVEGTEHHLESIPNKNLCIAELAAVLARFLERRH
jgi:hypothetical protein